MVLVISIFVVLTNGNTAASGLLKGGIEIINEELVILVILVLVECRSWY